MTIGTHGEQLRINKTAANKAVWQKTGATQCGSNFHFANHLLLSAGLYKFGDINNNELLIINLATVRAGRISNTSSSPSPFRYMPFQ